MKVKVTMTTDFIYSESREIEIEVPDGTKDVKTFLKEYTDSDEAYDEFVDADTTQEEFSDPDGEWYTTEINGERITWEV